VSDGSRADRLEALLAEAEVDALLVGDLVRPGDSEPDARSNIRWLTGFSGTSGFAIVGPGRREFLTDFRYTERAEREVGEEFDRITLQGRLLVELAKRLEGRTGFDDAATSVQSLTKLNEELPDGTTLVPATGLVERLRRTKDEHEIEAIAGAAALADEAFEWLAAEGLAGRTEREVALAAENRMRELGGAPSFPAIVAAGPNGAQPHAEPSDRRIGEGELVVIDMGAKLDGYCSDGTRTFASGEPGTEEREIYELVRSAQAAGLEAVRAGVKGVDADAASREPIDAAGHGEHYGHGLGHGVGLEVHERPGLGRTPDTLVAGDVITIEPGCYRKSFGGCRLEDLVLVLEDGAELLTSFPYDL
jgi:Xaa-Pro aminopeptidase